MKKSMFLITMLALLMTSYSASMAQTSVLDLEVNIETKTYKLDKTTHQFGKISKGEKVTAKFVITNTSTTENLILKNVKPSCGCTATGYSQEPIAPGERTTITATFTGKSIGNFTKLVTVHTNFEENPTRLYLKGEVTEADITSEKVRQLGQE